MENSILLKLIYQLEEQERKELDKFLASPYFNQRVDVQALYAYIWANLSLKKADFSKKTAFTVVYPKEAFLDAKMRHLMSYTLKLVKEFLIQKSIMEDSLERSIHLCRAYRKKGLNKLFEKEWEKTKLLQQQQNHRNTKFHYHNYQLHLERYEYIHRQKRRGEMNLQELSDELTIFYIGDILRQTCAMLTHQTMSKQDYDLILLEEVLGLVKTGKFKNIPAVEIYYYGYMSMSHPEDESHFHALKALIEKYWQQFPTAEIRDIYLMTINYCIQRLNSGHSQYIREAFEIYRSGLARQVLFENGYLSHFTYKNILKLGLELKEFNWVENYLQEFKDFLHPENRENIFLHNLAIFYFGKPDHDKAMQLLHQVEFKDVLHQLDARRMLLCIYYEAGSYDALASLLDSFQAYIRRQKKMGYHKTHYINLIRFVRKMLNSNINDKSIKENFRKDIENTQELAERRWLLDQLT